MGMEISYSKKEKTNKQTNKEKEKKKKKKERKKRRKLFFLGGGWCLNYFRDFKKDVSCYRKKDKVDIWNTTNASS